MRIERCYLPSLGVHVTLLLLGRLALRLELGKVPGRRRFSLPVVSLASRTWYAGVVLFGVGLSAHWVSRCD